MMLSPDTAHLDTHVLVYSVFPAAPQHVASRTLVDKAKSPNANFCGAPQNLVEFYAVVTDSRRVIQPKNGKEALQAIDGFLGLSGLKLLPVPPELIFRREQLLRQNPVSKKRAIDTQRVATMLGNGVMKIYTFHVADF